MTVTPASSRRCAQPLSITFAFVATHNHFVLDRSGKVFKQTAPVIKLSADATDEQYLALLGVLNSSVVCFWLKQVCQDKGVGGIGGGIGDEAWEPRYALNASNIKDVPLPVARSAALPGLLDRLAAERARLLEGLRNVEPPLSDRLAELRERDEALTASMVSLQEELDWEILASFGLADRLPVSQGETAPPIRLGERAFEIVLARQVAAEETETTWFERHGSVPVTDVPAHWPSEYRRLVERRIVLIESDPDVGLIERPEHKRRWNRAPWHDRQREALTRLILDALEGPDLWADLRPRSTTELTDRLRAVPVLVEVLELLAEHNDADLGATVQRVVLNTAVPHLAAQRFTESGLRIHEVWRHVWELQRSEERGERVGPVPVPPKYSQSDFRSTIYWRQRGKLDVPKERFVLIPNAERGADTAPVVGWAGWDEADLARALAGRVMELRELEAVDAERVTPLLAGVLELLPWIHQWHPDTEQLYGGTPGRYFEEWLDGQLAALATTRDNLRAWRPPGPARGRKAKAGAT